MVLFLMWRVDVTSGVMDYLENGHELEWTIIEGNVWLLAAVRSPQILSNGDSETRGIDESFIMSST